MTDGEHLTPVVFNWTAGFLIALFTIVVPFAAILTDRVKSSYQGIVPSLQETSTNIVLQ